jgi:hypothetical protein
MTDNNDTDIGNDLARMTPQDNPVKYVKNGSKTGSEAFADTLEWCRQASQLENCPRLTGGKAKGYTDCTCLYALRPQVEGQDSSALRMVTRWSCYVASLDNTTRRSLEIEWIKHANFWSKEHSSDSTRRTGYLLQVMATDTSSDDVPSPSHHTYFPSLMTNPVLCLIQVTMGRRWRQKIWRKSYQIAQRFWGAFLLS